MLDWMTDPLKLAFGVLAGPRLNHLAFHRLRRPADVLLRDVIEPRRGAADLEQREDILSMLLAAHRHGRRQRLLDELFTLLVAGHETTATALSWALERLAHHPHAWERLRRAREATDEDYLDAVVKETLRLRPVVPAVIRMLKAPFGVAGYDLPAGVAVVPTILHVHTREDIYPEPFAFRPERFLEKPAGTYTWIPFGGGVRRCLGASFALFEMKAVLRAVAQSIETLEPAQTARRAPHPPCRHLIPAEEGRVIAARRTAPARRAQPVPSGR